LFFALPWFYAQGYDILLYTLPHHGRRRSRLSPFSGHGLFSGGLSHLNESMAHAVHDFRIFVDYLESRGVSKIGVTGISLGGYTSALLAAVEDRLHFSIPNVPVASLPDLVLEWYPINLAIKSLLKLSGTSVREARHMLAVHSPLTYQPLIPKERLMVIAGAGDRLAPPKHARLLWDHWDRPRIHWFPGNHLLHLDKGKYLKEIARFLKEIGFDQH
ncbi:MAG: alpha/beta hydrolase, partial [Gammaproteobacteria bacterium]|nr:alpha/beta hydrolase [Gammaproteobacteria bacterium]